MLNCLRHGLIVTLSLCFLAFGVQVLLSAYQLQDPFSFVLTFFASNLIILISAAVAVGFTLRLLRQRRAMVPANPPISDDEH